MGIRGGLAKRNPTGRGYSRRVFKALVCFMLTFIAVGAIGALLISRRRGNS